MKRAVDTLVVGGGIGALCAAIYLGARGLKVELHEAAHQLGGKAAEVELDGIAVDTGPSVLTLPEVFVEVFAAVGMNLYDEIDLVRSNPSFRYIFQGGPTLDIYHDPERSLESVASTLGLAAADELRNYLVRSARIWEAAAPHFVLSQAPSVNRILLGGPRAWWAASKIDAFRTMAAVIKSEVKNPYLRSLLQRYATYNGSDVRRAPGTLGCIAHVELTLGGYGVQGGMHELVLALRRALDRAGVAIYTESPIKQILVKDQVIQGAILANGGVVKARHVVFGGDVRALGPLLGHRDVQTRGTSVEEPSMSAYNAIYKASRTHAPDVPHTVILPKHYEQEFEDIFDHHRVPRTPTIYLCNQSTAHGRSGWERQLPLFAMLNAPPASKTEQGDENNSGVDPLSEWLSRTLVERGLLARDDALLWWRTPQDLARRYPGSDGSLYGPSSNGMRAAFRRQANEHRITGLFVASGTAHPGGGVPMVAQSGKLAAHALLRRSHPQLLLDDTP